MFSGLEFIGKLWSVFAREFYSRETQYGDITSVKTAIKNGWIDTNESVVQNLVGSMQKQFVDVIKYNGRKKTNRPRLIALHHLEK